MGKTYVIGDVHGCYVQLKALIDKICPAADDEVILAGDMVDRGPDSPRCLAFAKQYKATMGNHERKHVRYRSGQLSLLSRSQIGAREQFQKLGPHHYDTAVDYMETLPLYIDNPDALIVHAAVDYRLPMREQDERVLTGVMSRKDLVSIDGRTGLPRWCAYYPATAKPIIFGHISIDPKIPRQGNLFPIDTGCYAGGFLTAISLPDFKLYQVPGLQHR